MAICVLLVALLLLPEQHYALLSSPSSRSSLNRPSISVSYASPLHAFTHTVKSNVGHLNNSNPFNRCNAISNNQHVNYHNQLSNHRRHVLPLHSSDTIERTDGGSSSETPLVLAMAVGIVSSFVGFLYSKCLKSGFNLLWNIVPSILFGGGNSSNRLCKLLNRYPAAYIVLVVTLGGGLVATLSTLFFPSLFSAHDYVHVLSKEDGASMEQFPSARNHLLPVMVLSLLTSISGFSLGPEAPMVTAGGLVGVSLARKYLQSNSKKGKGSDSSASIEETLAYAGAAGTLTGFMNVPLAGPIFAMEMTSRRAGVSSHAAKSWSAAMAASMAGMVFVRGGLVPNLTLGGHFTYGAKAAVGAVTGREMILASLVCGVGGAIVGTCFHKTIGFLKSVIWPTKLSPSSPSNNQERYAAIGKKTLVALTIGMLSALYPQTMFWGEGSMQSCIDGQCTPFSATPHGIPSIMTQLARVSPNEPYASGIAALQVGMAKFFAIALASAGKFPGGVIFPLLSNGASLANALISALHPLLPSASSSLVAPLMVMSFMAATLTSITRTPLATVLIIALTASGMTPLSVLLPGTLLASYVSVWVSDRFSGDSFFSYSE